MATRLTVKDLKELLDQAVKNCPYGSEELPVVIEDEAFSTLEILAVDWEDSAIWIFTKKEAINASDHS